MSPLVVEAAALVLWELVTNALRHAANPQGRQIGTRWERTDAGVRLEVHDTNMGLPIPQKADAEAESGEVLSLLTRLPGGVGVWRSAGTASGKRTWAVVGEDRAGEVLR